MTHKTVVNPLLPVIAAAMVAVPASVQAESLQVAVGQDVYRYGDFLSFTVTVPEVTLDTATFRIIDEDGMGSSTVAMAITEESTELVAPHRFLASQFDAGTYTITVEYDGRVASAPFQLIDAGNVVIPFWVKDIAGLWTGGVIDDVGFLRNLADNGAVKINSAINPQASVTIPSWFKANAEWWRGGDISDEEFSNGLQYLITVGAVRIEG